MSDNDKYVHATTVAEAACRLQDAIDAAEASGLRVEVSMSSVTTCVVGKFSDADNYETTRTTIDVTTSQFLSRGGAA